MAKALWKNCRHGHPLTPDNVYVSKSGKRRCRACQLQHVKVSYQKRVIDRA